MVGGEEGEVILQEFSKFSSEGRSTLGALIRYDFVIEAKAEVYFVEKECSDPFSSDVFLCGTENHPLSKPMVNHDQKGIKAGGRWEVSDEVTHDLLEGAGGRGANGVERGNGRMGVGLVLLAGRAAFDVLPDIGSKTRPPKFSHDELMSF